MILNSFFFFLLFGGTGDWSQLLVLAKQALYHLFLTSSFCCSYFSDRVSHRRRPQSSYLCLSCSWDYWHEALHPALYSYFKDSVFFLLLIRQNTAALVSIFHVARTSWMDIDIGRYILMCYLMIKICFEKNILRLFHHCVNIIECTYTNLDDRG
jgi:hypothetical protein